MKNNNLIGIFDSGMGGLSVLCTLKHVMPNESFIYYGDSKRAPYGVKSKKTVEEYAVEICDYFVEKEVKAIVVACNTATSAAVKTLRNRYSIPIIGMEPALKPACEYKKDGTVLVLATKMTLEEKKFERLMNQFSNSHEIIKIPGSILVETVEKGITDGPEAEAAVRSCFKDVDTEALDAVVLGCTHFVFLKSVIEKILGPNVAIFDGNMGTALHLKNTLEHLKQLNEESKQRIIIENSAGDSMVKQSEKLIEGC